MQFCPGSGEFVNLLGAIKGAILAFDEGQRVGAQQTRASGMSRNTQHIRKDRADFVRGWWIDDDTSLIVGSNRAA